MWHQIGEPPTESLIGLLDTVSSQVSGDGYSLCGNRVYTIEPSEHLWFEKPVSLRTTLYLNGSYPEFYNEFTDWLYRYDAQKNVKNNLTASI